MTKRRQVFEKQEPLSTNFLAAFLRVIISKLKLTPTKLLKAMPSSNDLADLSPMAKLDKRAKRRLIKRILIAGNFGLLLAIAVFVLNNRSTSQTIRSSTVNSAIATTRSQPNPLDQLSSSQIAFTAAQMTKLPELTAVRNQSDSEVALLSFVPNDTTTLSKPQIVTTAQKSKYNILHYQVLDGDTVDSLAAKFNITVGSITGSNSLAGTALKPGTSLLIPPGNGLVYKVSPTDNINAIASKYGADKDLLISVNDAERGLQPGDYIWIPNVTQPGLNLNYAVRSYGVPSYAPIYGYNGYDYGFCTWYVASRIPVPSNWGNANTWDDYARHTSGWAVDVVPRPGSIGQTDGGWAGHVAIVSEVSSDAAMIKYSDMNGLVGWGRVGVTADWVPASHFQHYIFPL